MSPRTYDLNLDGHHVHIVVDDDTGSGTITSDLSKGAPANSAWAIAIDTLESLMLAHAVAHCDPDAPEYLAGLETALEAIANQHGDE
jgi:hypothetical protein